MKNRRINKRVNGFTLIELIVVIAIIMALLGVLGPTMMTYYRKARIKAANADAKMVFNAAQTAVQTYIAKDRSRADAEKSILKDAVVISYAPSAGGRFDTVRDTSWSSMQAASVNKDVVEIINSVNGTVSGARDVCWTISVENYIVRGAISASTLNTDRVGYYTASKTQAFDSTGTTYENWLGKGSSDGGDVNSLFEVLKIYDPTI